MTDVRNRKKLFATDDFVVDLLMSLVFALSSISVEFVAIRYVQLSIPYHVVMLQLLVVMIYTFLRRLQLDIRVILAAHPVVMFLTLWTFKTIGKRYYSDWFASLFLFFIILSAMIYSLSCLGKRSTMRAKPEGIYFSLFIHFLLFFAVGNSVMIYPILVDAAIMVMCYLAARQLDVFEKRYSHSINTSSQSSSAIRKNNRLTVVILLLSVMVSLCALFLFPYDAFYRMLLFILRMIFKLINSLVDEPETADQDFGERFDLELEQDAGETPLLIKVILSIVAVGIALLLLNFFGTLIVNLIRNLRLPKFEMYKDKNIEDDRIVTDLIEDIGHDRKKIRRRDMGKGEEYRIRKKYYDTVRRAAKRGVDIRTSSTPGQIEKLILESGDSSISELTPIYQEIRYNKKGSSK